MSDDTRVSEPAPDLTTMASAPVFVDPTGRRERFAHGVAWAMGALVVAYLVLLVVSLVGPPGVLKFAVPGVGPIFPGAEAPRIGTGATQRPAQVFHSHPASTAPVTATTTTPSTAPTGGPGTVATVTTTPSPRPSATGSPTAAPTTTGRSTGSPTATPTVRSSSRAPSTGKPTARPTPTRGPR